MRTNYHLMDSGEEIEVKHKTEYLKVACCDCGLVHQVDFKVAKDLLFVTFYRDQRSTGQYRRWRKK